MEKIYSKADPNLLLHVILRFQDFDRPRNEILDPHNFLQSAAIRVNEGDRFRPHKHIEKEIVRKHEKTQECWVVIRGAIECELYDTDDTLLDKIVITEGSACYTLHGGHTFTALEDHTCVLEFKSSPYEGQARDKVFINDKV
jgi:hypothetical protein